MEIHKHFTVAISDNMASKWEKIFFLLSMGMEIHPQLLFKQWGYGNQMNEKNSFEGMDTPTNYANWLLTGNGYPQPFSSVDNMASKWEKDFFTEYGNGDPSSVTFQAVRIW